MFLLKKLINFFLLKKFYLTKLDACIAECYCGKSHRSVACSLTAVTVYTCEAVCNKQLACGNHLCSQPCHVGDCQPCLLTVDRITHCPCGAVALNELYRRMEAGETFPVYVEEDEKLKSSINGDKITDVGNTGKSKKSKKSKKKSKNSAKQQELPTEDNIVVSNESKNSSELLSVTNVTDLPPAGSFGKDFDSVNDDVSNTSPSSPDTNSSSSTTTFSAPNTSIPAPSTTLSSSNVTHPAAHTSPPSPSAPNITHPVPPESIRRVTCTDAVPTCGGTCGKRLPCGRPGDFHTCRSRCHQGPCPPCKLSTPVR